MSIKFDKFLSWCESRWDGDVVVKGNEIKLNSIFVEDDFKHHLWCNPYGGKLGSKERPYGVYRCFKSDKVGTLVSLVMEVDKCPFDEALETLGTGEYNLEELEEKIKDFFKNKRQKPVENEVLKSGLDLPEGTYRISELPEENYFRTEAEIYLNSRKMPIDDFMICTDMSTQYGNRILIPYFDSKGMLIYFNTRFIGNNKKALRYLGPPKEIGIGKSDVVFMTNWPKQGSPVYLVEGEFDAKTLHLATKEAGAALGGKFISEKQMGYIEGLMPVLCLDNDQSGVKALLDIGDMLLKNGFKKMKYVFPPKKYKDWNKMLEDSSLRLIDSYIKSQIRSFEKDTILNKSIRSIRSK